MPRRSLLIALLLGVLAVGALLVAALRTGGGQTVRPTGARPAPDASSSEEPPALPADPAPAEREVERIELAPAEPAPAQRGAFLRVVDEQGAPIPELALSVRFGVRGEQVESLMYGSHERVTDARGELDLAALLGEQEAVGLVALGAPAVPELRLEPGLIARESLGATRESAALVVARRREVAPVRGLVVEKGSGAPLADYPLRLLSWEEVPVAAPELVLRTPERLVAYRRTGGPLGEWVTTDAFGRFETQAELPPAGVQFLTYDKEFLRDEQHRIDASGRGVELRLELIVGPIVLLDFDPPAGTAVTDFIAALRRDGDQPPVHMVELATPRDPHGGQRGNSGNAGPVQEGSPPWVRLPFAEVEDDELPSFLVLESRDRRCFGSALFEDFERHAREPLRVELATREVLELRVEWPPADEQGNELGMLFVTLTPADAGPEAEPSVGDWVRRWSHEPVTEARLLGFAPGPHRLQAGLRSVPWDGANVAPIERRIELPRAEPLVLAPRLDAPAETHAVELVVRTASGEPLDGSEGRAKLFNFQLLPRGDCPPLEWSDGTARVTLAGVPTGQLELRPSWRRGSFPIEPAELRFDVPGPAIELLARDDLPAEELVVRVIEPEVRGSVRFVYGAADARRYSRSGFDLDDLVELPDGRRAAELSSGPYPPASEPPLVVVSMDGFERVWLTGSDIPPPDADGRRVVELVPRRGWSARVQVVTALGDGGPPEPAPGVVLAFDGVETAASDERGFLVHRASAEPTRVAVVTPGWQLVQRTSYLGRGTVHADGAVIFDDGELTVLVR